jgi:calnexin
MVENPAYQGKWEPRKISNPDYFEDFDPFKSLNSFVAIGLELWSMTNEIYFDNFLITDDVEVAAQFAKDTWVVKKKLEDAASSRSADSVIDALLNATNERPWLWAVYLLVILLPIVIIFVFCCGGSKSPAKKATDLKVSKKTDAESKDDEPTHSNGATSNHHHDGEEEEAEDEHQQTDDEDTQEIPASNVKTTSAKKETKEDLENMSPNDVTAEEETASPIPNDSSKTSPKKRRSARKE